MGSCNQARHGHGIPRVYGITIPNGPVSPLRRSGPGEQRSLLCGAMSCLGPTGIVSSIRSSGFVGVRDRGVLWMGGVTALWALVLDEAISTSIAGRTQGNKRTSYISVDPQAKSTSKRCIRVAAITMVIQAGRINIWIAKRSEKLPLR